MGYPGGKSGSGVYQQIINQMPPHRRYIEPFLGGGAIMRLKKYAAASIGIDIDAEAISAFPDKDIPGLRLYNDDALAWLRREFTPDTLIYLDPPYLMETRSTKQKYYRYEFSYEQHVELLSIITGWEMNCMICISGYWSDLYAWALAGWRKISFQTRTRGGKIATEWLWMNYPEPLELHDYRYLGRNFRERERIKRKKNRWKNQLLNMPELERHAILSAIDELRSGRPSPESAVWTTPPEMTMQARGPVSLDVELPAAGGVEK